MIPKDLVLIADPSGSWDVRRAGVASTGGRATDLGSDGAVMHLRFRRVGVGELQRAHWARLPSTWGWLGGGG